MESGKYICKYCLKHYAYKKRLILHQNAMHMKIPIILEYKSNRLLVKAGDLMLGN